MEGGDLERSTRTFRFASAAIYLSSICPSFAASSCLYDRFFICVLGHVFYLTGKTL